jgi:PAS domain S-box-containing protein
MSSLTNALPTREGKRILDTLFKESSVGFFIGNEAGKIEYMDNETARIVGYTGGCTSGEWSVDDFDAAVGSHLRDAYKFILGGSSFQKEEQRFINRHNNLVVINLYCSPYRRNGGQITGCLGVVQDITRACQQKAGLEETFSELSIILQISEALASTADLETVLKIILTGVTANQGLGFNRAFLFLSNKDETMLTGKISVGPSSPEEAGEIWSRLEQQNKTLPELLNDYIERETASSFTLSSLIAGWTILTSGDSVFCRSFNEGRFVYLRRSNDLPPESIEILNRLRTDSLVIAPIISKGKKLGLIVADNQITRKEIAASDMKLLQTFANATAVAIDRSRLYDELVEHAARLEEKNIQIARSQEQRVHCEKMSVIGELTSSIAHELRNPLTVIGGFANLMLSAGCNEENAEYLNIILSEAKRAETVLNQVLDFSRASRTEAREMDFDLLVRQTHELLQSRLGQYRKIPLMDLSGEEMKIWGNPDQLQHSFYQFIFMAVDEMTDECGIEINTSRGEGVARLTISFQGNAGSRDKAVAALEQIFRHSSGTSRLSIIVAGETIKYHGGDYGIESAAGSIPRIYIELPLRKGKQDAKDTGG